MQPQPPPLGLSQGPPQLVGRQQGALVYGRNISVGASPPIIRMGGPWVTRQRDPLTHPEYLHRQEMNHSKHYETQWVAKGTPRPANNMTVSADVGSFAGGGGAAGGRVPQYTATIPVTVGGPTAVVNSGQVTQSSQLRTQQQPNAHNTPSVSHHTVIHPHHSVLSAGAAAAVQQQVLPTGTAQVATHELSAQALQQGSSQQIQPVHNVTLHHPQQHLMYQPGAQNAQQQGSQQPSQVRRILNGQAQYYQAHTGQQLQNAQQARAGMAAASTQMAAQVQTSMQHQHQQFLIAHPGYAPQNLYQQAPYNAMAGQQQHRPVGSNSQAPYQMTNQHQQAGAPSHMPMYQSYQHIPSGMFYPPNASPAGSAPVKNVAAPVPAMQPKREKKILSIVDPNTNEDILKGVLNTNSKTNQSHSPAQSMDSSASTTPTPRETPPAKHQSFNIPAQFALQVSQVATSTEEKGVAVNKPFDTENSSANSLSTNADKISDSEINNEIRDVNCRISVDNSINNIQNVPEINDLNKTTVTFQNVDNNSQPQSSRPNEIQQPRSATIAIPPQESVIPHQQVSPKMDKKETTPRDTAPHHLGGYTNRNVPKDSAQHHVGASRSPPKDIAQHHGYSGGASRSPPKDTPQHHSYTSGASISPPKDAAPSQQHRGGYASSSSNASFGKSAANCEGGIAPSNMARMGAEGMKQPPPMSFAGPHMMNVPPPAYNKFMAPIFSTPPPAYDKPLKEPLQKIASADVVNQTEEETSRTVADDDTQKDDEQKMVCNTVPTPTEAVAMATPNEIEQPEPDSTLGKETTGETVPKAASSDIVSEGSQKQQNEAEAAPSNDGREKTVEKCEEATRTSTSQIKCDTTDERTESSGVAVSKLEDSIPAEVPRKISTPIPELSELGNKSESTPEKEGETLGAEEAPVKKTKDEFVSILPEPFDPYKTIVYNRESILEIGKRDFCSERPKKLNNLEITLDGPHKETNVKPKNEVKDFTPAFLQNNNLRNRTPNMGHGQRTMGGRNSQQGRRPPPKIIEIQLSSSYGEVKLKNTENAWKPSYLKNEKVEDPKLEEDPQMAELQKKMRGILNKLTPDNFEKLVMRVREFKFETYKHLDGIIGLIFEKAVDEQGFSSTYAKLCEELSHLSVKESPSEDAAEKKESKFRNLIICKCQKEFERDNAKDMKLVKMKEDIEKCDSDKEKELSLIYQMEETKMRKRSVGNIRFIGELYKLKMLTSSIMVRIISGLLEKKDDESLECLCKLLTTIGEDLEKSATSASVPAAVSELNQRFEEMRSIVDRGLSTSRIRFLLMDVIDMRGNNWKSRKIQRQNVPKKKSEVHADIRKEEEENQAAQILSHHQGPPLPRRLDDRERKRSRGGMMQEEGGWSTVGNIPNKGRSHFDSQRLKSMYRLGTPAPCNNAPSFRAGFGSWGSGSSGGASNNQDDATNRYNILDESNSGDMRRPNAFMPPSRLGPATGFRQGGFGSNSQSSPSEKDNVINSVKKMMIPGSGDRSKSNSRSNTRESSLNRESSVRVETVEKVAPAAVTPPPRAESPKPLERDEAEERTKKIVDTLSSSGNFQEAAKSVQQTFCTDLKSLFIEQSLELNLEKSLERRKTLGKFFQYLLIHKMASVQQLIEGSKELMMNISDLIIDIPQVREYMGEIFGPVLVEGAMTLEDLVRMMNNAPEEHRHLVLGFALKVARAELGVSRVSDLINQSTVDFTNILPYNISVSDFLAEQNISALEISAGQQQAQATLSRQFESVGVHKELLDMLKRGSSDDQIHGWIEGNVGSHVNNAKFIRILTTALIESIMIVSTEGATLKAGDDFQHKLSEKVSLIHKYVDNNDKLELSCLFAIQALCHENEHPPGLMEKCFNSLYEKELISDESFQDWERNKDTEEQLGKGVCVASVHNFLKMINELEPEDVPSDQGGSKDQKPK